MTDVGVCAICGTAGFLADKVLLFPFVAGILLGCAMPPKLLASTRVPALIASLWGAHAPSGSVDPSGGLDLDATCYDPGHFD